MSCPASYPRGFPRKGKWTMPLSWGRGAKPPAFTPYRMAVLKLKELRRQLKKQLDAGYIHPSKSPYGASVLFQKKYDGSL